MDDGTLHVLAELISGKGTEWVKSWLRSRLLGRDVFFPINKRLDEDPENLVIRFLRAVGPDDPSFAKIQAAVLELLKESGLPAPNLPAFFDGLVRICQHVRLPQTIDWFLEELDGLASAATQREQVWGGFAATREVVFAAACQISGSLSESAKAKWLKLLDLSPYATLALTGLGQSFRAKVKYLDAWWRSCPDEEKTRELGGVLSLGLETDGEAAVSAILSCEGELWPEDLKRAIDSGLNSRGVLPVFERGQRSAIVRLFAHFTRRGQDEFGVPPETLSDPALPEELRSAASHLMQVFALDRNVRDGLRERTIRIVDQAYSNIDNGLQGLRKAVREKAEALEDGWKIQKLPVSGFDKSMQEYWARRGPVLYTFPVFLTQERRNRFGVIPYALQRVIGVLLHRQHPSFIEEHDPLVDLPWVYQLIRQTCEIGGHFYYTQGYAIGEILGECIDAAPGEVRRTFSVSPAGISSVPGLISTPPQILADPSNVGLVFLFDLADASRIVWEKMGKPLVEYEIVACNHGLDIPVGVGFSLSTLPWLLDKQRYKELYNVAVREVARLQDKLRNIGISPIVPSLETGEVLGLR